MATLASIELPVTVEPRSVAAHAHCGVTGGAYRGGDRRFSAGNTEGKEIHVRLATLIISLVLMLMLGTQSCGVVVGGSIAESLGTTTSEKAEGEDLAGAGAAGVVAATLWLFGAGFVMRKPRASMWLYLVAGLICLVGASAGFTDLFIWAVVSVGFALMSWRGASELQTVSMPAPAPAPAPGHRIAASPPAHAGWAQAAPPPGGSSEVPPGASQPRSRKFLRAAGIGALVVLALGVAGSLVGSDDEKKQTSSPEAAPPQDTHGVGETAHTGDFDITLHEVRDPFMPANEFEVPDEGHRFVAVEMTAHNAGDETKTLSTLLGAEIIDSMSRHWDIALAGIDLPRLDGSISPGESRRGWMVFEVAGDSTDLRLRVKGNLTAKGALFVLNQA